MFVRSGATWIQQAYIKASNTGVDDVFGCSVAVSGDTVVVGARGERSSTTGINSTPNEGARYSGAAYVFVRSGTTWSQQAYLKASNSTADHKFGNSVGVSGNTVVVGSQGEDSSTTGVNSNPNNVGQFYDGGAAYVFVRSGTTWIQQAYLKASNTGVYDEFGCSVAVSGDTVVIGAYHESSSTAGVNTTPNEGAKFSGATYVFVGLGPIPAPEIAIQQAGTVLASSGTMALGSSAVGSISERIFTLLNIGDADLFLIGAPKVAVTGSSDFTVIAQPTSPVTGPSGSTTFTVRFTPSSIGSKIANLSIPNNDANENPFVINLIGDGVTAASIFNGVASGSGLTGSDAEPDANPFNDGVNNLLKYAFNMNLGAADSHGMALGGNSGLPAIMLVGSGPATMIRVEYLRRIGSGLVYAPKRSINLGSGTFVPMIGTPVITPVSDAWERVVVQDPADPATLPTLFAIIEVLIP